MSSRVLSRIPMVAGCAYIGCTRPLRWTSEPTGDERVSLATRMAIGERARRIFRAAAEEADALKHQHIGLAHILLGVLREPDSAATLLDRAGMHLQSVRDDVAQLLNEEPL